MKRLFAFITLVALLIAGSAFAQTVKVGMVKLVSNAPMYIGMEKGFFKDQGITVKPVYFGSAAPIAAALASGSIDVGATGITGGLYNSIAGKLGTKIVFDKGQVKPGFETSGLFVASKLADSVKSIKDLKGHTIGVTQIGSTFHYMIGKLLEANGMSLDEVKVVPLNSVSSVQQALTSGKVDAAILPQPFAAKEIGTQGAKLLQWADDSLDYEVTAIFYSKAFMNHADSAAAFSRGYLESVRYYYNACIKNGKDNLTCQEIIDLTAKTIGSSPGVVAQGLYPVDPNGALNTGSIKDQIAWYSKNGFLTGKLTLDDVVDTSYQKDAVDALK
jgi:NitT/TauT family transport system substrate-binding protein